MISEIEPGCAARILRNALAVVINPENDWATDVTMEELVAIYTAEKWSDVNPEWPDEIIERYIPGTDSGTCATVRCSTPALMGNDFFSPSMRTSGSSAKLVSATIWRSG